MSHLYVIGGQQRDARSLYAGNKDWTGYQKGLVLMVDTERHTVDICLEYVTPPEYCALEDPAISFQASTLQGEYLYTCTETEVLVYKLPGFELTTHISLPCFNDLHHVRPTLHGTLLVANAGLEMVLELTHQGTIQQAWNVLGEEPWASVDPAVDYRKISTKPHRAHPNYLFSIDGQPWVTRFHQGDAIALNDPSDRINISNQRIHDGVVYKGKIHFTTVDGTIVIADAATRRVEETIDLSTMHPDGTLLGWCRSLYRTGDQLWVGFSRIRPTKIRANVAWVLRGFKNVCPTHIACYDLRQRRCVAEIDLESTGLAAIYSIFPVPT